MKFVRFLVLTGLLSLCGLLFPPKGHAQSLLTASKRAEISVFGGYMASSPDFGTFHKAGFAAGADFTLFPHLFVAPSLEIRYDTSSKDGIGESAFLAGIKAQKDYGRFHPYLDVLVGTGTISYNPIIAPADRKESGLNLSLGGGVDVDIVKNFSLKADLQQQNWNLGGNYYFQPDGADYTLTPVTYILGVVYHIPFKGLRDQRQLR